jgi:DNA-directed RNA polymerase subunit RPC12/RpoP
MNSSELNLIKDPNEDMTCPYCGKRLGDSVFYEWLMGKNTGKIRLRVKCYHCNRTVYLVSREEAGYDD